MIEMSGRIVCLTIEQEFFPNIKGFGCFSFNFVVRVFTCICRSDRDTMMCNTRSHTRWFLLTSFGTENGF